MADRNDPMYSVPITLNRPDDHKPTDLFGIRNRSINWSTEKGSASVGSAAVDAPRFAPDGQSLYEQLKRNEAESLQKQKEKPIHLPPKPLDEDEIEFLQEADEHVRKIERKIVEEESSELQQFHNQVLALQSKSSTPVVDRREQLVGESGLHFSFKTQTPTSKSGPSSSAATAGLVKSPTSASATSGHPVQLIRSGAVKVQIVRRSADSTAAKPSTNQSSSAAAAHSSPSGPNVVQDSSKTVSETRSVSAGNDSSPSSDRKRPRVDEESSVIGQKSKRQDHEEDSTPDQHSDQEDGPGTGLFGIDSYGSDSE